MGEGKKRNESRRICRRFEEILRDRILVTSRGSDARKRHSWIAEEKDKRHCILIGHRILDDHCRKGTKNTKKSGRRASDSLPTLFILLEDIRSSITGLQLCIGDDEPLGAWRRC
jgi:hypothetical protein